MAFRFKPVKRAIKVDLPSFPRQSSDSEPEDLSGEVQGKTASAPEERFARALDEQGIQYIFRYVVGAPKGLPGWKELDFLIHSGGLLHAAEVDTAFTHRNKQQSDILHDAIVLNDQEIQTMGMLYPQVQHVDGDSDLASMTNARNFVKQNYTKGNSTIGRANEYNAPQYRQTNVQAAARKAPQVTKKQVKKIVNKPV